MSKFISLHRHPQFERQQELVKAAQLKGYSSAEIWGLLDACAEDQREALKDQHEAVATELNSYNALRGRGRHRQVITPEQAPQAQSEGKQQQDEQFDQAAFEADAIAAAKTLGAAQGRKAAQA